MLEINESETRSSVCLSVPEDEFYVLKKREEKEGCVSSDFYIFMMTFLFIYSFF